MFKSDSMSYLGFGKSGKAISGLESSELCLRVNLDNALRGHVYKDCIPNAYDSKKPLGHRHFEELTRSEFLSRILLLRENRGIEVPFIKYIVKYKFHFLLEKSGELFCKMVDHLSHEYPDIIKCDPKAYQLLLVESVQDPSFKSGFFSSFDDYLDKNFLKVLDVIIYLIEKEYKKGNVDVLSVVGETMFDEKPFLLECFTLLEVDLITYVQMTKSKGYTKWDLYKGFV